MENYEWEEHQAIETPRKRRPVWLVPVIGFLILIVVAGASFYGGISYQKGKQPSASAAINPDQAGQPTPGQQDGTSGPMGSRGTMGQVTAINASSISLQDTRAGSTMTYSITSSTKIMNNNQSASVSEIEVGDSVVVIADTSNSSQAAQIMLNPTAPGAGGYGQSSGSST